MNKPAYKRGPYKKHKQDSEVEMDVIRTEEALSMIESIVDKGIKASEVVDIPQIKIKQGKGDEEEMVLLFSDLQVGHKSPTTNIKVLGDRLDTLAKAVVKIASLQRNAIPIKKLDIFMLGDMIQSEDITSKVDLDSLEMVLMEQVFTGAIPMTEKFLISIAPHFPGGIDVYCVPGNHGNVTKMNAPSTNWDTIIYKILQSKTANYKKIRWHIEEKMFYQMVDIMGKKFMLAHGDCIPRYLNIPIYGITQRAMRWQGSIGNFDYLCLGHFHTPIRMDWNNVEVLVNGCFMSDDQWVLKSIGMSTQPSQMCFGVHPRKGISFLYKLKL
jgi:UDP-2,3-diacylglucosamine pyrophosphatase LpxH